jgi:hypothetical protein
VGGEWVRRERGGREGGERDSETERERERGREREEFHNDGQNLKYMLKNRFENGKSIFEIRSL